jgi:hypothetical protein
MIGSAVCASVVPQRLTLERSCVGVNVQLMNAAEYRSEPSHHFLGQIKTASKIWL